MRRICTVVTAIALAACFVLPAMAETKFSFKGAYRVRGFMLSNPSLQADQADVKATGTLGKPSYTAPIAATGEGPSQSWMDMRFRMESTFTVSERLSVVTRFDALDNKKYGYPDDGAVLNHNIDFDRAYMVITTDFGRFQIGRMAGGAYGNSFLDAETETDRVRFDTKLNNWLLTAIFQKNAENDSDSASGMDILTDADDETYYAAITYMSEDIRGGVLTGYNNNKTSSDNIFYDPTGNVIPGFPGNPQGLDVGFDSNYLLFDGYLDASFGDFGLLAEGTVIFGKYAEWDRDCYAKGMAARDAARKALGLGPQPDIDYDAYAWNVEGTWDSGPFGAQIGYAWVKGEDNIYDDKMESPGGVGDDWGKAFILTNTDSGFEGSLGGHGGAAAAGVTPGNLSSGSTAAINGMKMFYLGASYSPLDNLKISGLFANSKAESPGYVGFMTGALPGTTRSFASDHGSEYDLTIDWDVYDNLNYTFIAAYLDTGDYWQFGNPYRELENTWCFWQQLKLDF